MGTNFAPILFKCHGYLLLPPIVCYKCFVECHYVLSLYSEKLTHFFGHSRCSINVLEIIFKFMALPRATWQNYDSCPSINKYALIFPFLYFR